MSTSQTRDGKNYVCSLSRKVHMHANGNRYRRDAIKHPASTVRSHSLLGNIVENLWSLPGRHGDIFLKSKHSDSLWEHVFWSSSHSHFLLFGLVLQWQHEAFWKRQKESLGYLTLVQDVPNDTSSFCLLWWEQQHNLPHAWKCHLGSAQPLWKFFSHCQ